MFGATLAGVGVEVLGRFPPPRGHFGAGHGVGFRVAVLSVTSVITTSDDRVEGARFHAAVLGSSSGGLAGRVVALVHAPLRLLALAGRRADGGGEGPGAGRQGRGAGREGRRAGG